MLTGQNRERTEQLESQLSKANRKLESANQERSRLAISNSGLSSNLESAAQSLSETRQALREASQERDEAIQVVSDLQAAIAALNRKLEMTSLSNGWGSIPLSASRNILLVT